MYLIYRIYAFSQYEKYNLKLSRFKKKKGFKGIMKQKHVLFLFSIKTKMYLLETITVEKMSQSKYFHYQSQEIFYFH